MPGKKITFCGLILTERIGGYYATIDGTVVHFLAASDGEREEDTWIAEVGPPGRNQVGKGDTLRECVGRALSALRTANLRGERISWP